MLEKTVDLQNKSLGWFLYNGNIGYEWVNSTVVVISCFGLPIKFVLMSNWAV